MLQSVDVRAGATLLKTFAINEVNPSDILIVTSITGLDPADVTLFTGEFARAGGYYQGRRPGQRNVVINLKINPNYVDDIEVSDIREMLYSWFFEPSPTSDEVVLVFHDDRKPDRFLLGYTEKLPADIFSKETKAQVSLICVDPFFLTEVPVSAEDSTGWITLPIEYDGTARTGIVAAFKINTATDQFVVDINGQKMTLDGTFAVNDVININTIEGGRQIRQNGSDIMTTLTADSTWPQLSKGTNTLKVYGNAEGDGKAVLTSYFFQAAWWGI